MAAVGRDAEFTLPPSPPDRSATFLKLTKGSLDILETRDTCMCHELDIPHRGSIQTVGKPMDTREGG